MMYARTAYNRSVCASPLSRLGLRKNAVGLAPFVRFFSATFFVRWNCFAIPLSRTKNVAYSRNVRRKYFELVGGKVYKKVYKKLIKNDQKCSFIFKKKI